MCGIKLCPFVVVGWKLVQEAPALIEECTVNMECELIKTVDFPSHDVFLGRIAATYCDEAVLTEDVVDFGKVQPILFVMNDRSYWKLGNKFAKAWDVGKGIK